MKYEEYKKYKELNLDDIDINSLIHIDKLNLELPYGKRIAQYIYDDINPYFFVSHGLKVETIYKENNITISDLLITYFSNLK